MATSAFRSTTKRASPISGDSAAARRSRSLSRFSRPIQTHKEPRGKFPEISLDDLALELFSSSSSWNENGSDGGGVRPREREREREERRGRSVSRRGELGRWACDTASSRRKSQSVSRTRGDASGEPATVAAPRRRRSLSVARPPTTDFQSEVNHFQNSSNRANMKAPTSGNGQTTSAQKATASSNRRLRRTQSYKDLPMSLDGYSSHSSALTDDESKDTRISKNGFEKIIRPVYSQKKHEPPSEDVVNGGLYEVMRQELRYAVQEIRSELNQLEKSKQGILNDVLLVEQRGWTKTVKDRPDSRTSSVVEKPSRARKKSSDPHRMSRRLTEEAEKYFEDFISNIEDTDISSFDGDRSDASSTLGGTRRPKDSAIRVAETYRNSSASTSFPGEMEGVIFPWLQWETSNEGTPSSHTTLQTPVTPKSLQWQEKDTLSSSYDPSNRSSSSQGSWSPALFTGQGTKQNACQSRKLCNDGTSCYDLDERNKNEEQLLFDIYRERKGIGLGHLLLCNSIL